MPSAKLSVRLQIALVVVLFLGSLAVLLVNALSVPLSARQQLRDRDRLRDAGRRMAESAGPIFTDRRDANPIPQSELDERLRAIAAAVLADFPGVEGGFFLGGDRDRFGGYAFPTTSHGDLPPLPRNEPPPLEAPYIRLLSRQCLVEAAGQSPVQEYAVGPSRVLIAVEPVGTERPAPAAAWAMIRLTGPEQLESRLSRSYVSLGLALAGMAFSFLLVTNLGKSLARQRRDQERLREELRRAEHLASLGRLLAGVAHEVRTPLAGLRSTVQLWQRLPDTARDPATLEAVIRAVDRLNEIVSRLLYFARTDTGERQPLAVNDLLTDTIKLLAAQAAAQRVSLELVCEENLPTITGSAGALRQVFLNLATNALQAMPAGGRLRLEVKKRTGGLTIRIADTGPGVSPQDREHLFEPFFTTRPEGTGLGLALCREIVGQHGGRIDLEPGGPPGAVFRIELPAGGGS